MAERGSNDKASNPVVYSCLLFPPKPVDSYQFSDNRQREQDAAYLGSIPRNGNGHDKSWNERDKSLKSGRRAGKGRAEAGTADEENLGRHDESLSGQVECLNG